MRWAKDEVDLWVEAWAAERRKILGLADLMPADRIGKLNSTLGAVREEGEGASQGSVTQTFPEVYTGTALLVNRAWKAMHRDWRAPMEAHYVYLFDLKGSRIKARTKAQLLEITPALYWKYIGFAKNYVHSFVIIGTQFEKVMETRNTSVGVL